MCPFSRLCTCHFSGEKMGKTEKDYHFLSQEYICPIFANYSQKVRNSKALPNFISMTATIMLFNMVFDEILATKVIQGLK